MIVDAASTVPPLDHLRRWIRWGCDLVIYSGGKGIRGPQDSGLLAGRADLIEAARLNGSPNSAIGRGMKVSKEAMAGLWMALDLLPRTDHESEFRMRKQQAHDLSKLLEGRTDIICSVEDDWEEWPAPTVRIFPLGGLWSPEKVRRALMFGNPPIHVDAPRGTLQISAHGLMPGEEAILAARIIELMDHSPELVRR